MPELESLSFYKEIVTEYPCSTVTSVANKSTNHWDDSDFTKADLGLKDLSSDVFYNCNFDGVTFEKSVLKYAKFFRCSFVGAKFLENVI